MESLRVAVGSEDEISRIAIRNILQAAGHTVIYEETDGPSLLRKIRGMSPDFVIASMNLPGIKGVEIARIVQEDGIAPALLIADGSQNIFSIEMGNNNYAYIIKPISSQQLLGTMEFVYNSYKKMRGLQDEINKLKNMLETRKAVDLAKGILIDQFNMKEKDAFRYLQKKSMDECKPIHDIADRIINKYGKK